MGPKHRTSRSSVQLCRCPLVLDLKVSGQHLFAQHPHWRNLSYGPAIGVIYGGTRGIGIPTFWTEGYRAVNRGDLRRLNYNKTVFGRRRPRWESLRCSPRPQSRRRRDYPLHSPPLISGPKCASFSLWIGTPHFLDQSYALGPGMRWDWKRTSDAV